MPNSSSEIVIAKKLAAAYKINTIWEGANFTIRKGELVGLLGPNGAGKTTLFRLMLGLIKPSSGTIELFGERPKSGNMRVGYMPQHRWIDTQSKLEVLEYIRLGASGIKLGFSLPVQAATERREAIKALRMVDGHDLAHRSLSELSGGELQRVFLAQALISKPEILLLDEPLANLDIKRESQLVQLVSSVVKKQNIAAIVIAHDINPLLPVVDRIIYIANGKIVAGKPSDIITSQTLSALYESPIEVLQGSKGQLAVLGVEEAIHHDA